MRVLSVIVAALVWTGIAAAHSPRVIGIGQKENKDSVTVNVGDTLVVALPGNPSTGYSWRVVLLNRRQLRAAGAGYVRASLRPLAQGATGVDIHIFKVVATGTSNLKLSYVSRTRGNPVERLFVVRVTVDPPDR